MYSKAKGINDRESVTPPPGYDGNRFSKKREFDDPFFGDTAPSPTKSTFPKSMKAPPSDSFGENGLNRSQIPEAPAPQGELPASGHRSSIPSFFKDAGKEELLLIALILMLAEEKGSENKDALLLLVLLG